MTTNLSVFTRDSYNGGLKLCMSVQDDIYTNESLDILDRFNTAYGAPDNKATTTRIDSLACYHRPELTIYSAIARQARKQDLLPDIYESMQHTIDYTFSILTRTPVLIERRNANSIISTLSNIGAVAACLGKINEFISFAHNVIDNHLYVAESSLSEHYGRNFADNRKFTLPESVDPYKSSNDKDVILSEVYEKISMKINDSYFTHLITESMNRDPFFIEEQLNCKSMSHRRAFIYPTLLFPTITSFISWYLDKFPNTTTDALVTTIFYNDSIIGGAGNFRYLEKDADWFNSLIDKRNVSIIGHLDVLSNVLVHDIKFLFKLNNAIPIDDFFIPESLVQNITGEEIMALMKNKKSLPRSLMKSTILYKLDIPIEFFVANIEKLYLNTNYNSRKHFESKYTLAEVTALLK